MRIGGKHPLRRRWMWLAFAAVRGVCRWLPLPVAQAIGSIVGLVIYALLARYRSLARAHLRMAFGESLSEPTERRIARRVFMNLGRTMLEWFVIDRLSPAQLARVVDIQGLPHMEQALQKGRGAICVSAHFGNWELGPMSMAQRGFQGAVIARQLRYPEYQDFLWSMRERKGVRTIDRGAIKPVLQVLRANQLIGMMPDQDMDSVEGLFVEFFGRPAYTPVGPAALSMLTGAPIVPCFVVRVGRRFRLVIEEPIAVPRTGDRAADLIAITQAWSRRVEAHIRAYPDHWVWMHRRWKTQPPQGDVAARDGAGVDAREALAVS